MSYYIDLQNATEELLPFSDDILTSWAELALHEQKPSAELTLRFVDSEEISDLNHAYRKQNKATNVLAFPASLPPGIELDLPLLGDIIICPAVLAKESVEQGKPLEAHWAHIVIHGVLHLLGYDHIEEIDANQMQAQEIKLLAKLNFANPYEVEGDDGE